MSKLAQAIEQDELRQVLSQHAYSYLKEGETVASVIEKLGSLNENADHPLDQEEINEIVKEKTKNKRSHKDNKDNNNNDNNIYTSYLETPDFILEQISSSPRSPCSPRQSVMENPLFIKYSKLDDTWETVEDFTFENNVYCPIADQVYSKGGVLLPSGVEEYEDTAEIITDIKEFIHAGAELPPLYENLFPYLALFYWVYEKFPFIPYVQFVGGTGTGKTTAMEAFGSICYKAIDTTGSLTISSIFRMATNWKGTMLIDEFDAVGDHAKEMVSFLKSGVSDRLVYRTEGDIKKFDLKAYVVKAPKLFTSEKPIEDAGLQSRTIVIEMQKNTRAIPLYKLPKYYDKALSIRNKLLLWRLRNLNKIDLSQVEYGFKELTSLDRRVQQVVTPIYYFSDEGAKKEILLMAKEQEEETLRERRESQEGKIFEQIVEAFNANTPISLGEIATAINRSKRIPIEERMISQIVRNVIGFRTHRVGTGEAKKTLVVVETPEDIAHLHSQASYYGVSVSDICGERGEDGEQESLDGINNIETSPLINNEENSSGERGETVLGSLDIIPT